MILTAKEIRTLLQKKELSNVLFIFKGISYNKQWMPQEFLIVQRKKDGKKFINVHSFLSASDKNLNEKFYFKPYIER